MRKALGQLRLWLMILLLLPYTGNENKPLNNAVPAGCPSSVAVTAISQDDGAINSKNEAASFSNYLWLQKSGGVADWTPDKLNRTIAGPGEIAHLIL